ncbi:MAG TPA: DUF4476 domain-containing protein, partial [Chitinophagaceae bacterium]|nr:DUF4476 domain-containing protein [Chitinophagaceae bacterium]
TTINKHVPEISNSDCKNFATDHDLDKLRIRLLDDKTIDEKIASARKFFKAKCYSVSQIKALTELFPTDETKYRFFDTSYAFVSDTGRFFTLEEVFSNEFYKNKFKALIHK